MPLSPSHPTVLIPFLFVPSTLQFLPLGSVFFAAVGAANISRRGCESPRTPGPVRGGPGHKLIGLILENSVNKWKWIAPGRTALPGGSGSGNGVAFALFLRPERLERAKVGVRDPARKKSAVRYIECALVAWD